jgi:hypothetical protein
MHVSHRKQDRNLGLCGAIMAAVSFAALTLPFAAVAQTNYHDPQGRFDLQIPAGWEVTPDQGVDQIIVRKGAVQEIIVVEQQNKRGAMTAKEFIDATAGEFRQQCPTSRTRQSGAVTLAGSPGVYSLFTCSDPKSPAVAEVSSTLTKSNVLIGLTMIAPLAEYYTNLPALDGIRDSLRITGSKSRTGASTPTESQAMTELKKACLVGAFEQEDCARRVGILLGQQAKLRTAGSEPATSGVYRDPQRRFSVNIPEGWSATSEGENGALGVQLRSGSNWINIMPAEPARSASEVVLHQEQKVAVQSNSSRKVPFGTLGLVQLFGNGLEVTYDYFTASSMQGNAIETYIAGVGKIDGTDQTFLLLVASIDKQQGSDAGAVFLSVAQSIRLAAH